MSHSDAAGAAVPGTGPGPQPTGGADRGPDGAPPDAGRVEPVEGTGTGLLREVGRMADGRRITYYRSAGPAPGARA